MELRHLRYFAMAAEERNVSRAATRLFVSQPAVSRQIKDLEEELGVKLFIREHTGLRLTEAGNTALAHALEILRQANAMTEAMDLMARRQSSVVVNVGFLPTALPQFLGDALRRFHKAHVGIKVHIFEMSPTQQAEALGTGAIDLALIGEPTAQVKRDFKVAPIFKSRMAMLLPDEHPLVGRKSVRLAEFEKDSFLTLHEDHFPDRPKLMADMFERAGIDAEITFRARGLSDLLGLIGAGAGVAIAPAAMAVMPHPGVVFVPLSHPRLTLTFMAAWRKGDAVEGQELLLETIRDVTQVKT